jgi:collagenase-like PrtC family protease
VFRIEAAYETPKYRLQIGQVYRAALESAVAGDGTVDESAWQAIREHTAVGLCNGFYFGRTGSEYVGKRVEAIAACG